MSRTSRTRMHRLLEASQGGKVTAISNPDSRATLISRACRDDVGRDTMYYIPCIIYHVLYHVLYHVVLNHVYIPCRRRDTTLLELLNVKDQTLLLNTLTEHLTTKNKRNRLTTTCLHVSGRGVITPVGVL